MLKRTVLWAVFFCVTSQLTASVTLAPDTIIIDGITVGVTVEEGESNGYEETGEVLDTVPKEKMPRGLEFSFNQGISFSELGSSIMDTVSLNEFVGCKDLKGKFSNLNFKVTLLEKRRHQLLLGVSYTTWSEEINQFQSILEDSLYRFDSPAKNKLEQITVEHTELGLEYDTIPSRIGESNLSQTYLEFPISYGWRFVEFGDNSSFGVGVSVVPGFFINSKDSEIDFVKERSELSDTLLIKNTLEFRKKSFNLSGEGVLRYEKKYRKNDQFFVQIGYRRNFSDIFEEGKLLIVNRKSFFLGVGVKIYL